LVKLVRFVDMSNANDVESLRPIERRVLDMQRDGVAIEEIATRFNKTPEFVERLIGWTEIPRTGQTSDRHLTPRQRRVLDLRAEGESHEQIADRFKRTERYIRQVEGLAHFKEGQRLLSGS
jgi:DNA-binding NarL/FixJ family response regulator